MKIEFKIYQKYIILFLIPFLMLSASINGQSDTNVNFSEVFEKNDANLVKESNWDGFYGMADCMAYKDNYGYFAGDYNFGLIVVKIPFYSVPTTVADFFYPPGNESSPMDIAVLDVENYIYLATYSKGLKIFYFDNTTNILSKVGDFETYPGLTSVNVKGEIGYITTDDNRLITLNISNPSTPTFLDEYDTGVSIRDLYINNNLTYLSCYTNGIHILNVTNPTSISFHNSIALATVQNIVTINEMIFAISNENLVIYNQTDVSSTIYSTVETSFSLAIKDNIAYIAEQTVVELVDISDVTNPLQMDSIFTHEDNYIRALDVDRNFLFFIDHYRGFDIYDCFDPYNVEYVVSLPLHAYESDIYIEGTTAYIAAANFSLVALNIGDPTNPIPIAYYDSENTGSRILAANNYLFVMSIFGVVEVLNPQLPISFISDYTSSGSARQISIHGNRLYIATSTGFEIVDISNPNTLVKIGEQTTPSYANGIFANNNDTIYTITDDTLYTWDVTNPAAISMLDSYSLPDVINDLYCVGQQIIALSQQTMYVLDISNPSSIDNIGSRSFTNHLSKVKINNNICIISEGAVGIHLVNITDLTNLPVIDTINDSDSHFESIYINDDYICLAKFDKGVDFYSYDVEQIPVIDPTPATTPTTATTPPGSPSNLMLWLGIGLSAGVIVVILPLSIVIARKRMIAKRELIKRDAAISQLTSCYHCGYPIRKDATTCEDCGKEIIRCVVCKLPVSLGDTLGQCSLCEAKAHYEHMLDWVQKRGKCPHCQQKVPEDSVIAISSDAEPKKKNDEYLED